MPRLKSKKRQSDLYNVGRKSTQKEALSKEQLRYNSLLKEKIPENQRVDPTVTKREQLTAELIAFYRKRPDVCCEQLLGIKLNLYQKILIRGSWDKRFIMWLMSRGLGKTWLGCIFIVLKAILYNNLLIGIVSPTYIQSKRAMLDKIEREILRDAPFLLSEYSNFSRSQENCSITFHNASRIKAVSAGQDDNSSQRGDRYQIIMADEYFSIQEDVINRVINPSMNNRSNYKVGMDVSKAFKNQLIITTTSYYRFNHLWREFKTYLTNMLNGDTDYAVYAFPYQVGIDVGLFDEVFINKEKQRLPKDDFDMEYGCQFPAIGENSWIKPNDLEACADLEAFYLSGDKEYETIISVDVARTEGGDNSVFNVGRLKPNIHGDYEVDLVFTRTMNGARFVEQHVVLRDLLKQYPNTIRVFMDIQGLSKGLYDECLKPYWDAELQKELFPIIAMNDDQAKNNIKNGIPLIYGINGSTELNHNMGMAVKKYTQKHLFHMYNSGTCNNTDGIIGIQEQTQIIEAEATRREIMKIEAVPSGNYLKFQLPDGMKTSKNHRKDRWIAVCMLLWGAEQIAIEKLEGDQGDGCLAVALRW